MYTRTQADITLMPYDRALKVATENNAHAEEGEAYTILPMGKMWAVVLFDKGEMLGYL